MRWFIRPCLTMSQLRFDHVSKRYPGGHEALSDVSFSVDEGEMLFVTGHSGAGKSTLLRLIHLSERPTRGTVFFGDRNLALVKRRGLPAHRRRVGVVFQDHRLLMDRSLFENVALPLVIAGVPRAEVGAQAVGTVQHECVELLRAAAHRRHRRPRHRPPDPSPVPVPAS